MRTTDILKEVAQAHNCIANIPVSGDNVILMANAITALRSLAGELQKEIAEEDSGWKEPDG